MYVTLQDNDPLYAVSQVGSRTLAFGHFSYLWAATFTPEDNDPLQVCMQLSWLPHFLCELFSYLWALYFMVDIMTLCVVNQVGFHTFPSPFSSKLFFYHEVVNFMLEDSDPFCVVGCIELALALLHLSFSHMCRLRISHWKIVTRCVCNQSHWLPDSYI